MNREQQNLAKMSSTEILDRFYETPIPAWLEKHFGVKSEESENLLLELKKAQQGTPKEVVKVEWTDNNSLHPIDLVFNTPQMTFRVFDDSWPLDEGKTFTYLVVDLKHDFQIRPYSNIYDLETAKQKAIEAANTIQNEVEYVQG